MFKANHVCRFFLSILFAVVSCNAVSSEDKSRLHQYVGLLNHFHGEPGAFVEAVNHTDLLSADTSLARVFRYLYLREPAEFKDYMIVPKVSAPTEEDWQTFQKLDELLYASFRAGSLIQWENAQENLLYLKKQLLLSGNKAAVAQVAMALAIYYFDYGNDVLSGISELLYAMPALKNNDEYPQPNVFYDRELALFLLFANLYDLGAFEAAYQYGVTFFNLIRSNSKSRRYLQEYFVMVNLTSEMQKYDEAMAYADELIFLAQSLNPSNQLYALIAKVSVYARRNKPGDLQAALQLVEMARLKSSPQEWDIIEQSRMLVLQSIQAGLKRNSARANTLVNELSTLISENPDRFSSLDLKHLSLLRVFIAETSNDASLVKEIRLARLEKEQAYVVTALEKRLDSWSDEMASDITLVNLENIQRRNEAQQQAIETANLKTIIILLVALLIGTLAAWLFVQRRRIHQLAYTDPLTNAPNRRFMFNMLTKVFTKARKGNCIALLDIDHFKKVNDTYGHQTGDEVLVKCSQLIRQRLRSTDQYCRYGGEEFLLLLKDTTVHQAQEVMDDIRSALHAVTAWQSTEEEFAVSFSCGLVELSTYEDIDKAIAHCDTLLYTAKNQGRGRTVLPQGAMQPA